MLRTCSKTLWLLAVLVAAFSSLTQAAGLLVADGGMGGLLEIEEQSVDVVINNGIAVTTVDQTFQNLENRIVEALYTFPVPNGASVANFSMWINGKEMTGEVVEKQRARQIYESYKARNIDPGLLEQVDFKTFEMRVFPIPAGGQQRVKITYYQQLDVDNDWATYVYPLASDGRRDVNQKTAGRFALSMRVLSEVPIAQLTSPSHPEEFVISNRNPNFYEASLESVSGDLSKDVVLSFRTTRPQTGVDLITSKPKGDDGYFMLTVTAGEELEELNGPMDYIFILDVSGSMAHDSKLLLSRKSLGAFVESLGPEDRFEVMTFNIEPTALFGELATVDDENMERSREFLAARKARGGTELRHAVRAAYKYGDPDRRLNVVILSDGMTEQSSRSALLQLIKDKPNNATVFAVGVGNDVDRPLLSQLTEEAGGLAAFISHGDDFARKAAAFRRKLTRPVAANLAIDINGADVYDMVPAKLPNLYHGAPIRVFGRFRNQKDFEVKLSAEVAGKPFQQVKAFEKVSSDNPEIERMWASTRINELLRDADRNASRSAVQPIIVNLAERYSVVTEYTSFIVLENDAEYRRWKIARRNDNRMKRDASHHAKLDAQLEQLREESMSRLGPQLASRPQQQPSTKKTFSNPSFGASPTPEPSSHLMMLMAAGWLLLSARRRRS